MSHARFAVATILAYVGLPFYGVFVDIVTGRLGLLGSGQAGVKVSVADYLVPTLYVLAAVAAADLITWLLSSTASAAEHAWRVVERGANEGGLSAARASSERQ